MGAILVLLIALEVTLRLVWRFGKMPLYAASDEWEYMTLPNQSGMRLGNKFYFNRYGMISNEVDSTKKHVLGLGDSVINGGVQTELDPDQKVLAGVGIDKKGKGFNPGFDELKQMADSVKIPMVVFLHADAEECKARKYNSQGWEIIRWCESHKVKLVKDLDCGFTPDGLRDGIHLNAHGQRKLAKVMEQSLAAIR